MSEDSKEVIQNQPDGTYKNPYNINDLTERTNGIFRVKPSGIEAFWSKLGKLKEQERIYVRQDSDIFGFLIYDAPEGKQISVRLNLTLSPEELDKGFMERDVYSLSRKIEKGRLLWELFSDALQTHQRLKK